MFEEVYVGMFESEHISWYISWVEPVDIIHNNFPAISRHVRSTTRRVFTLPQNHRLPQGAGEDGQHLSQH